MNSQELLKKINETRDFLAPQKEDFIKRIESNDRADEASLGLRFLEVIDEDRMSPEAGLKWQGATFNLSDEVLAFVGQRKYKELAEVISKQSGEDVSGYDIAKVLHMAPLEEYREENPWQALGHEAAGAAMTVPLTMGASALKAASLLPRVATNIASRLPQSTTGKAALSGAVSGYGAGDGGLESITQAGEGAVLGGSVQKVLTVPGRIARAGLNVLQGENAGKRIARKQARRLFQEAVENDLKTPEEALAYVARHAGMDVTPADLGENTKLLMDALATFDGPGLQTARRYLESRQMGRPARINTILEDTFGKKASFYSDMQALKASRGRVGNKLYGEANKVQVDVDNDVWRDIFKTRTVQEAFNKGLKIAQDIDPNYKMWDFSISSDGRILDKNGMPQDGVNTRFLHFIKLGMDDVVWPDVRKPTEGGLGPTELRVARDVWTKYLDALDTANPAYRRARNKWSDDSSVMKSMEEGRQVLTNSKADINEITERVSSKTDVEKEAYRLGVLQGLTDQIEKTPESANIAWNLMKSKRRKNILRTTFPKGREGDEQYDKFMSALEREKNMSIVELAGLNTQTQRRSLKTKEIEQLAAEKKIPEGPISSQVFRVLQDDASASQKRHLNEIGNELANLLIQNEPGQLAKNLTPRIEMPSSVPEAISGAVTRTSPMVVGGASGRAPEYLEEDAPVQPHLLNEGLIRFLNSVAR